MTYFNQFQYKHLIKQTLDKLRDLYSTQNPNTGNYDLGHQYQYYDSQRHNTGPGVIEYIAYKENEKKETDELMKKELDDLKFKIRCLQKEVKDIRFKTEKLEEGEKDSIERCEYDQYINHL